MNRERLVSCLAAIVKDEEYKRSGLSREQMVEIVIDSLKLQYHIISKDAVEVVGDDRPKEKDVIQSFLDNCCYFLDDKHCGYFYEGSLEVLDPESLKTFNEDYKII